MKFSNILFAVFGLSTFVAALPAPVPAADTGLNLLEKRDLIEREPVASPNGGGVLVDLVADVQVCIDAVVVINKKYAPKKPYTRDVIKAWSLEIVAQIKVLIAVISAYPDGCTYPSIDVCVDIFVKLLVAIFVQLKVFIDLGGIITILLLTVDLLLGILLGLVGELLDIVITLLVLIEAKIKVGICGLIIKGCGGLISALYIQVIIKLCLSAGIVL